MNIKEAMASYFLKLEELYRENFGTIPTVSWSEEMDQELFIGEPDEDGEIQWKPKEAILISSSKLCDELIDFYSSYYYWELKGKYKEVTFIFPAVPSYKKTNEILKAAIDQGNYYFPNENIAFLASCYSNGNDDLLLFFMQKTGELFLYDIDKKDNMLLDYSLIDLISSMEAVI